MEGRGLEGGIGGLGSVVVGLVFGGGLGDVLRGVFLEFGLSVLVFERKERN